MHDVNDDEPSSPEPAPSPASEVAALIAAAGGDFTGALSAACAAVVDIEQVPRATIRLVEGPELRAWGATDGSVADTVPIDGSIEGLAVRERQVVLCDDASTDDRAEPEVTRRTQTRSWLVLPLMHGDVVVGTLSASAPEPDAFGAPQRARQIADTLRAVADALAAHLRTAAWLSDRHIAREETQAQVNETYVTAEMMSEGVIVFGRDGHFRRANNAAGRLLGINLEQIAGRHVRDALRTLVHEDGSEWPGAEQPPAQTLATGISARDVIMGVRRPQGTPRWVSVSSRILPDAHGAPNGVVVVLTDCTERRGLREQLDHATLHDEITGLPNKSLLHLEVDDMLDRSRRQGLGVALVHVHLTNLPGIRTRVGAHGSDDVLRTVGERLQQTVRDGEMVARTGDDEFGLVLGLLGDTNRAVEALLARIRGCLAEPVALARGEAEIEAQFVVSAFPEDGRTADALLRHCGARAPQRPRPRGLTRRQRGAQASAAAGVAGSSAAGAASGSDGFRHRRGRCFARRCLVGGSRRVGARRSTSASSGPGPVDRRHRGVGLGRTPRRRVTSTRPAKAAFDGPSIIVMLRPSCSRTLLDDADLASSSARRSRIIDPALGVRDLAAAEHDRDLDLAPCGAGSARRGPSSSRSRARRSSAGTSSRAP